jgi:hypothetical protein
MKSTDESVEQDLAELAIEAHGGLNAGSVSGLFQSTRSMEVYSGAQRAKPESSVT